MKRYRLRIASGFFLIILLLLMLIVIVFSNSSVKIQGLQMGEVKEGLLHLAPVQNEVVKISGSWYFSWNKFIASIDEMDCHCVLFPGSWKNCPETTEYGFASYGLYITGLEKNEYYALHLSQIISAYEIIINGKKIVAVGTPGKTKQEEKPKWDATIASFLPDDTGSAEIILHISNFQEKWGGTNKPIYIGKAKTIFAMDEIKKMANIFAATLLGVFAAFFFILFLFRKKERYFLWFSLLCYTIAVRGLCYDEFVILDLFPQMNWSTLFRIGYLTFPFALVCISGFLYSLFPAVVKRKHAIIASLPFALYFFIIIVCPISFVASVLIVFQLISFLFLIWAFSSVIIAFTKKQENSFWVLLSLAIAVVFFVWDLFIAMWLFTGTSISHFGLILSLFSIAFMVIARYSRSFVDANKLSNELEAINKALKRFIPMELLELVGHKDLSTIQAGATKEMHMAILYVYFYSSLFKFDFKEPEEVFSYLNEFLNIVSPEINKAGGFIAQYDGDGLIALFPSGVDNAVKCAVQLQSSAVGRNRIKIGETPILLNIGIDAGSMAVASLGDSNMLDSIILANCIHYLYKYRVTAETFKAKIVISSTVFSSLMEPQGWFIRPIDRIEMRDTDSLLFEVYNNDVEPDRQLKWLTKNDLERGLFSYFVEDFEEAKRYLVKVLSIYPDDIVTNHYLKRLNH